MNFMEPSHQRYMEGFVIKIERMRGESRVREDVVGAEHDG